jgi:uncharacterized membrane protein YkoI
MIIAVLAATLAAAGRTALAQEGGCLSPGEMREIVAAKEVVAPVIEIRAARRAAPGADITRARLCRSGGGYVYVLSALRRDGRFVEVTVDASSGKVASSR